MQKKITILLIIICFVIFNNFENNFQKRISHLNYDFFQKLFETEPNTNAVIIVDIDEKSLKQLGQFPWRRDIHSTIINNLNAANAKVIAFDIFFSEPDKQNPQLFIEEFNLQNQNNIMFDSDQLLSDTIEKSNVILPVVGAVEVQDLDQNLNIKANLIKRGETPSNYLYTFNSLITSLPKFNEKAKGLGTISIIEGEDGILRSVPMMININDTIVPALSLEAIRLFNDQKSILIETNSSGIQAIKTRTNLIKTDENALINVKYRKFDDNFYISASDIFYNQFDQNRIKDKIVLIGSSAQGIFDLIKTPSDKIIPGVEVHATIIENVLSNDFLITNHTTKLIENVILILSLILVIIFTSYIKPAFSILFFAVQIAALFFVSLIMYKQNYFIDVYNTILTSIVLFTIVLYWRFIEENKAALDNEKKQLVLKKEREIAGEVQKKLFPDLKKPIQQIFAMNVPARDVSGDYFDHIKTDDEQIYFTLADVSGKGVKAGMLMANASSIFKTLSKLNFDLNQLVMNINNQVKESSYQGMFITAVIGRINLKSNEMEFVNFGHESIMIYDKNKNTFDYQKASLPPLGLMNIKSVAMIKTSKLNLENKKIFIYTDGVTEGYLENGQELTAKGVEDIVLNNKDLSLKDTIEKVVKKLNHGIKLRDDITMLGIDLKN
ncbi:CHASE2 domain-containing protein [Candidatus Pelagibacter ubique]|nr:CHASE2 domain-containing protein [Candidatus Pelagibacter ubique]